MSAPLVWPQAGSSGRNLLAALERVLNEAAGLTASGHHLLPAYLDWAVRAVARLRPHLANSDVDRLIRTSTFWTGFGLNPDAEPTARLIAEELVSRQEALRSALQSLEHFQHRFSDVPEVALILVPDTNVLTAYAQSAREADWRGMLQDYIRPHDTIRIVVPLVVIDELDKLKQTSKQETRTNARLALKLIHELLSDAPEHRRTLQEAQGGQEKVTIEVLMEAPEHKRLPRGDDELVDIAVRLQAMLGSRVAMATFDTGADFRAATKSLSHVRLQH